MCRESDKNVNTEPRAEALSTKDREEVKWIKVQRNIAILGVFAAMFSTSLEYMSKFYEDFTKATLIIKVNDEYLSSKSLVSIYHVNSDTKPIIKAHPGEISEGLRLKDGSYYIKIELHNSLLYEENIFLVKKRFKNCFITLCV